MNNIEIFYLSNVKEVGLGIINYNKILDFRKDDILEIVYYMENPMAIKNLKLNEDSKNDLYKIKICKVHRNHFNLK